MPEQLLNRTDPTQLKVFDNRVADTVEQNDATILSRTIEFAKLAEEDTKQGSLEAEQGCMQAKTSC